jgi:thioredoxin 1
MIEPAPINLTKGGNMSKVIEVTDENFEKEVLNSDLPTEVDFWAPWCGPCMMVSPIYDKLSDEYQGRFKFCKLNVDENQRTAMKYQIMSIPMQMFFADGQKVDEILGAVPERTIRTMVEGIAKDFPTDEKGRLKSILTSWVEHNREDSEKFRKWKEKVNDAESDSVYRAILQGAQDMESANDKLLQLLTQLEGRG